MSRHKCSLVTTMPHGTKCSFEKCASRNVPCHTYDAFLIADMTVQIFLGSGLGFLIAVAIGATFIAIWFTKASDLYKKSEKIWEGKPSVTFCTDGF